MLRCRIKEKTLIFAKLICLVLIIPSGIAGDKKSLGKKIIDPIYSATSKVVGLSGDAGTYGQLYSVSGREARRPNSTGRIFLRPTFTVLKTVRVRFELLYSTEGTTRRQDINRIALHPRWRWGQLHIGDFSHSISSFTMRGISIRGGGVELHPGKLRFEAIGGETQRAVEYSHNRSYKRRLYVGRLGIGKQNDSYFDLVFLRAMDNTGSLPADSIDYEDSRSDTVATPRLPSSTLVTPQENMTIAIVYQLRFFNKRFLLKNETAASVHTSNMYSSEVSDLSDVPSVFNSFFKARSSTSADYAYQSEAALNLKAVTVNAKYMYIGPGFVSLGLNYLINDRQNVQVNSRIRLLKNKLSCRVNYSRQNDNLLSQKAFTTTRGRISANMNMRFSSALNVSLSGQSGDVKNDSEDETNRVDFVTNSAGINGRMQIADRKWARGFSVNYTFQNSKDNNPLRLKNSVIAHNVRGTFDLLQIDEFAVVPGFGFSNVKRGSDFQNTTATYSIKTSYYTFDRKLKFTLSFNADNRHGVRSYETNLGTYYLLGKHDSIFLQVRSHSFRSDLSSTGTYDERFATINMRHRF